MESKIYWHLPGFCYLKNLNQIMIELMNDYPYCFHKGYCVGSVYGTFPGAIWNGGRTVLGFSSKNDIVRTLKEYNDAGVPVRFTWTNSLVTEEHLNDTLCNMIMRLADNGMNQVLVNRPVLEDYLREKYPNYKYTDPELLMKEFEKDYFMVVLDYDLNHNEEVLKGLEPVAERVEILVDEICYPNCPRRVDHYRDESEKQLEFEIAPPFDCPNKKIRSFEDCKKRPSFISNTDINDYIDRGFCNFKLVGRGLPQSMVLDSYLYFLVKEEHRDKIRARVETKLQEIALKKSSQARR